MINKTTINPYDLTSYSNKKIKMIHDKKEHTKDILSYKFEFSTTGSNTDRLLLLSAGYMKGTDSENNYFLLDDEDIQVLIDQLVIEKSKIEKSKSAKAKIKELHEEMNGYLKKGYIESITMEYKANKLPPYYSPLLYKAFIITPNFRTDIDIPDNINIAFNFLEVLHLDLDENKFDESMNYIRNYNDIPIHFIGYDRDAEIQKRMKQAINRMDDYADGNADIPQEDRKKYVKMLEDLNIPLNVLNHKKK